MVEIAEDYVLISPKEQVIKERRPIISELLQRPTITEVDLLEALRNAVNYEDRMQSEEIISMLLDNAFIDQELMERTLLSEDIADIVDDVLLSCANTSTNLNIFEKLLANPAITPNGLMNALNTIVKRNMNTYAIEPFLHHRSITREHIKGALDVAISCENSRANIIARLLDSSCLEEEDIRGIIEFVDNIDDVLYYFAELGTNLNTFNIILTSPAVSKEGISRAVKVATAKGRDLNMVRILLADRRIGVQDIEKALFDVVQYGNTAWLDPKGFALLLNDNRLSEERIQKTLDSRNITSKLATEALTHLLTASKPRRIVFDCLIRKINTPKEAKKIIDTLDCSLRRRMKSGAIRYRNLTRLKRANKVFRDKFEPTLGVVPSRRAGSTAPMAVAGAASSNRFCPVRSGSTVARAAKRRLQNMIGDNDRIPPLLELEKAMRDLEEFANVVGLQPKQAYPERRIRRAVVRPIVVY